MERSAAKAQVAPALTLAGIHDLNERCIELLVNAARADGPVPFPLVAQIRDLLRAARPEVRRRAAKRSFLLLDMEFRDEDWWKAVRLQPNRPGRLTESRGSFHRRLAVPLARGTLVLAWQSVHADIDTACVLLGMSRGVAGIVGTLPLSAIDAIADRRFRNLQPRWHDRPALWRALLLAAESANPSPSRALNLHALQLTAGELVHQAG